MHFSPLDRVCKGRPLRAGDVQAYLACEQLTELLIYLMVLFSPWAFGSTQTWSIRVMNSAGYLLGAMLAVKLAIRRLKGYRPPRWEEGRGKSEVRNPKSEGSQMPDARCQKSEVRSQKSGIRSQ